MKKSLRDHQAEAGYRSRHFDSRYVKYKGFHVLVETRHDAPDEWLVRVMSYYKVSEPEINKFTSHEQALSVGKLLVDSIIQDIVNNAYKVDLGRI